MPTGWHDNLSRDAGTGRGSWAPGMVFNPLCHAKVKVLVQPYIYCFARICAATDTFCCLLQTDIAPHILRPSTNQNELRTGLCCYLHANYLSDRIDNNRAGEMEGGGWQMGLQELDCLPLQVFIWAHIYCFCLFGITKEGTVRILKPYRTQSQCHSISEVKPAWTC